MFCRKYEFKYCKRIFELNQQSLLIPYIDNRITLSIIYSEYVRSIIAFYHCIANRIQRISNVWYFACLIKIMSLLCLRVFTATKTLNLLVVII